ncbi:MAG: hypothetical protein II625_05070 [Bacilli bacterium]|nr:hypothetical protein [Bacilli bacterium]
MKEATGELNMTVITVVAIAAVAALFTFFLLPRIRANITLSSACANLNSKGNYGDSNAGVNNDNTSTGSVECTNFECTVEYQGHQYSRNCRDEQ